ncbi:insulinase family protein [Vicingus serpentipes]|jgi:zinc protease|uniref:Insulinase family protein n=1 Tax=Vicingus serpentipes TaxID=1926625 RepID=A0A5C6RX91_9FLAO|nr:pitrilysin family protein [Vicingus serpentipes]TXB66714.1 insulinase family protein [Vicingus serpentipes]
MRKILMSVALCAGILSVQAQNKIEFEQYKLKNGMNVILHEDHSTPIVAVTVLYHVGSKNENPERTGFAHFFEHLLFEGSENIERGEYMKLVQSNGGILNANTSFDRTFYFEILPSNQLELGLWLESERLLHAKIDETGVETQREVVKEEYRQRYDNQPYGTFLPQMFKRAFVEHPYQWVPIGSLEHLNQAKIEEFRDFYKTYYVPNNATLSIAGDFNKPQLKKWIETYFGSIPKGTKEMNRPTVVEPIKKEEVRDVIYDNVQLPAVMMGYHTPAQGTPDSYAVSMLAQILSQGKSSRLQKSVMDEQQKALFVGAFPFPTEDPGMALMFGITNMGVSIDDLEAAIDAEVEKVQTELISDDEFQKLKNQIENDMISQNSKIEGIAESLANYSVYYGDANLINTEIDRYLKVTKEDIKRVANEYFRKDNRVVLHYLPKSEDKSATEEK